MNALLDGRDEAVDIVSRQGWLSEQPLEFRRRFLRHATVQWYDTGQTVFKAGDLVTDVLGLVEGALEMYFKHPYLGQGLIHIAVKGMWVGEQVAYGLDRRVVTLRARVPSSVIAVPAEDVELMLAEDPYRLKSFGLLTQEHITECLTVVQELLHNDAVLRLSARLLTFAVGHPSGREPNEPVSLPIAPDELAHFSGLSRKAARRALEVLEEVGVVRVGDFSVEVLNLQALALTLSKLAKMPAELEPDDD